MKCFFHKSDLDGHCSGAIVKNKYPDCEMIGVDYSDNLELFSKTFLKNETIIVVDFCFNREDMEWLNDNTDLHWIDHHISAIEKMKGLECKGIREIGQSGCELTWKYLHLDPMPLAVKLLGRYDVWDHKDAQVLPFQYGFRMFESTLPDSDIWNTFLKNIPITDRNIHNVINTGKTILNYEKKQNEIYANDMSFEIKFEGYRAIVINKAFTNSKIFDSVYDPEKHDIMILFGVKPGQIKYTLYSTKSDIDVSKIAAKYGGGGHAGAAGFLTSELII